MKTRRNFFLINSLILSFFLVSSVFAAEPAKEGEKKEGSAAITCNQEVMRSYLLKGRKASLPDPMLLCPTIKNNCCGKLDQQRIFHVVNDILPQRTVEYESKMKMAIGKLKNLHSTVIKKKPLFLGTPKRKLFCGQQSRKLVNFSFAKIYQKLMMELENIRFDMNNYYNTFFCVLCDAGNHKFIELKTGKMILNADFCKNMLKNYSNSIKVLYIELIAYLENLQNVVDCHHYLKSYNLKFFEASKSKLSQDLAICLNNVTSKNFLKFCKSTCETLQISKINYLIEGDFEFLIDAVNLFEKFFEFKESGNFISMKLRMFFKKFTIPRNLTKEKKEEFIEKLDKKEDQKKALANQQRSLRQVEPDMAVLNANRFDSEKNVKNTFKEDFDNSSVHLSNGRLLEEEKKKKVKEEKPKTARMVVNKDLIAAYEEINITPPELKEHVYPVATKPVDIDKLQKVFVIGDGINPLDFEGQTKFHLPHDVFYKQLFSFRKPDAPDANLLFFLSDFSEKNKTVFKLNLSTKFKMDAAPAPKKQAKRILEDGNDDILEVKKLLH